MLSFAALAPSSFSAPITSRVSSRSTVSMTADVSRRALLTTAAGAMFMPLAAQADGANSAATQLRARGIYGALHEADLLAFLPTRRATYDVIAAADVLNYLGDLAPALAAIRAACRSA